MRTLRCPKHPGVPFEMVPGSGATYATQRCPECTAQIAARIAAMKALAKKWHPYRKQKLFTTKERVAS